MLWQLQQVFDSLRIRRRSRDRLEYEDGIGVDTAALL